jgi:Family of unknown function (DUF5691)
VSTWHDLVTASLIGTERSVVPEVPVPGLPAREAQPGDPAAILLDRAALLTAARRAGRRPDHAEPLPACEPDPRPVVSPAAWRRLARLLGDPDAALLIEWLTEVAAHGLRLPPQYLPSLLEQARRLRSKHPSLARLAAQTGGPRARWLAALNPDWEFAAPPVLTGDDAWRVGDRRQRREYLTELMATEPDAAQDLIKRTWPGADPGERIIFLRVLADGLGLAAEPLLEAALDDPAPNARTCAADLLAWLPGSALGQRMADRALRCVRVERSVRGPHLVIVPPAGCDASMGRDGIEQGRAAGPGPGSPPSAPPERARLLREVVARTPLRTWTDAFGLTAAQVVALRSGAWAPVLFTAWTRAAITQRDHQWTAVLIGRALAGGLQGTAAEVQALGQLARRADPVLGVPDTLPELWPDAPPAVAAALGVLRFRYDMLKELADDPSG